MCQISFAQTWIRKLDGYSLWSIGKDYQGNIYAGTIGSNRGIFKSTNGGENWVNTLSVGANNYMNITCDSLNNVYVANQYNGLLISTNGGTNWTNIDTSNFNNKSVQSVACGKNGYIYVGCTNGGVFRSTNYGATFTNTGVLGLTTVEVAVDKFDPNFVYAGVSSASAGGFYRSTDAGLTFSVNLNPTSKVWKVIQTLNGDLFTVSTTSPYSVCKSTNNGLNWTTMSNFSSAKRGACLDYTENIYASGNGGVFKSTNGGTSFVNFNFTTSSHKIISFQNRILVAVTGTTSGGVWIYIDTTISNISNKTGSIPSDYFLEQNYPNPFNPITTISYGIPNPSHVKLRIFDALGRELETLVNKKQEAGNYEINWPAPTENALNYGSGVYYYRLETDEFSNTKSMILIK